MRKFIIHLIVFVALLLVTTLPAPLLHGETELVDLSSIGQPPFADAGTEWVDSLMQEMSLEEKIAQMMMVYSYSNKGPEHEKSVIKQVKKHQVGGILFFQGSPSEQLRLVRKYQGASRIPLLMAIDGEHGLGMRLDSTISYPVAMSLGSINDDLLLYQMGRDMARQFRRTGIHMNMAPVADVNSNPANPVIGSRAYSSDPERVAQKVTALVAGMQKEGLLVAAKHFPGHGDTDSDSHHALPVIRHDRARLDSVELLPFRRAIQKGLSGIMVAHLEVPALESRSKRATTLSAPTLTGLLKEEMGFEGLIITDALNMKGLSSYFKPGVREVEAVKAGNDILLMPSDLPKAISSVKRAVRQGEISQERIDESCRKILRAKYWSGLATEETPSAEDLIEDLHRPGYYKLYSELLEHSLVLLRNDRGLLPLQGLENLNFATLTISGQDADLLAHQGSLQPADRYLPSGHYYMSIKATSDKREEIRRLVSTHDVLLVNLLSHTRRSSRAYGMNPETGAFLRSLAIAGAEGRGPEIILNLAAHPYALGRMGSTREFSTLIMSHGPDSLAQDLLVQALFGARSLSGRLPVPAGEFRVGDGVDALSLGRLSYGAPYEVGLNADTLARMDAIIAEALEEKAIPGCQVLVARKGRVVLHKCYGHHTYRRERETLPGDIYDLASVTKMASMTAALMKLRDQDLFHEDSLLGNWESVPDDCNKTTLKVGDVLAHQAKLRAWIPFYYETMEPLDRDQDLVTLEMSRTNPLKIGDGAYFNRHVRYIDSIYSKQYSEDYPWEVAEDLYLRRDWRDTIYKRIYYSELSNEEFRYSGLGFYMFNQIVEEVSDTVLDAYVWHSFYAPLGAYSLGYRPQERFPAERIVPTENDIIYRRQLLQGHVHDMGAAMLGGVSGNAGLFGSANDLAKMMQMYLDRGSYGGKRYISGETLERFTSRYNEDSENHRGLGFNKPVFWEMDAGPACDSASRSSFGHSGFTGTLAWADPENGTVFIFLSNRVHPDMGNSSLIDMDIRTRVQQVVYDAIED